MPSSRASSSKPFARWRATARWNARYKRWFLSRLPSGSSIDLPMSPQLESIFQTMAVKPAE